MEPRSIFNANAINGIAHAAHDTPIVRVMRSQQGRRPYENRKPRYEKRNHQRDATPLDSSTTCKACLNVGHCATKGDICYILAKATLCHLFISNPDNERIVKENLKLFRKDRKDKAYKSRTNTRLNGVIHKLTSEGASPLDLDPFMKLAHALECPSDYDYSSDDESYE